MVRIEIEAVQANWIGQALSSSGKLPPGTDVAEWRASRFAEWWKAEAKGLWEDDETTARGIREALTRPGGWQSFGEALHEHIHSQVDLGDLRAILGF